MDTELKHVKPFSRSKLSVFFKRRTCQQQDAEDHNDASKDEASDT